MDNIYSLTKSGGQFITPGGDANGDIASSDISRVLPRQLSTGSTRGTQTVGYGNVKIDGSNNRITIGAQDGTSIGMGQIPNSPSEVGLFALDSTGKLVWKQVGPTTYVYDPANNYTNVTQDGLLPDGTGGFVAAKPGVNVADLFA